MEKEKNKLISGALILTISGLIVKILGFIYKIPLSYILSDEGMSYFNSAYTVYTFFYIVCTAGVPKAISILIAESEGEGKGEEVKKIYSTSFCFFMIFGILLTVLFIIFTPYFSKFIGNKKTLLTMLSIAPSIMFVCASGVIRGYYNGVLNLMPVAVSEVIGGFSKLALGLIFAITALYLNFDLYVISALTMLGTTLGSFFSFLYLMLTKKWEISKHKIKQKTKFVSLSVLNKIMKIAFPLTLASAIASISGLMDLTIIMRGLLISNLSELQAGILYGNYTTLVLPLFNLIATVIAPVCTVFLPIVSKLKKDNKILLDKLSEAFKIIIFISVPVSVLFLSNPYRILAFLFEDSSAAVAAPLLFVLAPGVIFMCILTLINTVLEGLGNTKIPLISLIIGAIVKFIVSFMLIKNINFGILGAPIGTTISYIISFIISSLYLCAYVRVKINFFVPFLSVLISSVISTIISEIVISLFVASDMIETLLYFIIWFLVYLFLLFVFKFFKLKHILILAKCTKNK